MLPPIVIGAHPKRQDSEPIELGVMLSRLTGAPLEVVGTFWFDTTAQRTGRDEYRRVLEEEVQRSLEQSLSDAEQPCGEVRFHVKAGSAAVLLAETAAEAGAGAVVVGSTHRGSVGSITLGTTVDRVLDRAPCPVIVAPRGFHGEAARMQQVGVAFVDTPGGRSALRAAAAIARCAGASLTAYTVIEPHTHGADRERAESAVESAIAEHAGDVHAEARVLTQGGVDALIAEARDLDILVRGCRGRGPVRPPLAFGLPSKLARLAPCPFVIVPPDREQRLVELFSAAAGRSEAMAG